MYKIIVAEYITTEKTNRIEDTGQWCMQIVMNNI